MSDWAVYVENLSVRYGDFVAVDCISFKVPQGEIFGFLGANGAGKTTTIRVLCGLLQPSEGDVRVGGASFDQGAHIIKTKVGYMSQKFTLYNDLTIEENLNFTADLRKLDRETYLARRKSLLEFIAFDRPLKTIVQELSGGIKQQIALVSALLHEPEIIFLDEPTAGVSPAARSTFWLLIGKLAKAKKTVFVTTHYMDEAEQCGRIALMRDGKIIGLDTPDGLKKQAFPTPMLEFDPHVALKFSDVLALKSNPLFSFFEPYGLRFHATLKDETDLNHVRKTFEHQFAIRQIRPSLEDVFIRQIEGIKS